MMCIVVALFSIAACAGLDRKFERRLEDLEARQDETSTRLTELAPLAGVPKQNQEGTPQVFEGLEPVVSEEVSKTDCPSVREVHLRAETGTNCATYQAEIAAYIGRCVENCDPADLTDIARRTVELAAARCSEFCTNKGCGARVTFIPPPQGCAVSRCLKNFSQCTDPACPDYESCGLIQGNSVWNCFCRDLIPN
jgi:hypothetical protein